MSESQFRNAWTLGYGDGRHDALKGTARSNCIWCLGGMAVGLLMGLVMFIASKGGL